MSDTPSPTPTNPDHTARRLAIISATLLLLVLLCLAGMTWHFTRSLDVFVDIFSDMGEKLPALTMMMLAPGPWGWGIAMVVLAALLVIKEVLIREPIVRLALNLTVGFLVLATYHLYLFAMQLPMWAMLHSMQT